VGATFRSTASGLPANSFGICGFGFQTTSRPLQLLVQQGMPGCSLLVDPLAWQLLLPNAGAAEIALAIPDSPALVGVVLHQQVAVFELGAQANMIAVTSTNGLTATVGLF